MDQAESVVAEQRGTPSRSGEYAKVAKFSDEILQRLVDLMRSHNENAALGAAKTLYNKLIPDLKSVEFGGALDENGDRQPLRLLINAGNGFLPATITVSTPPTGSTTEQPTKIQSVSVAPQGTQDLHGDNGNSQTGPS